MEQKISLKLPLLSPSKTRLNIRYMHKSKAPEKYQKRLLLRGDISTTVCHQPYTENKHRPPYRSENHLLGHIARQFYLLLSKRSSEFFCG
jgi:hypothetical protein